MIRDISSPKLVKRAEGAHLECHVVLLPGISAASVIDSAVEAARKIVSPATTVKEYSDGSVHEVIVYVEAPAGADDKPMAVLVDWVYINQALVTL